MRIYQILSVDSSYNVYAMGIAKSAYDAICKFRAVHKLEVTEMEKTASGDCECVLFTIVCHDARKVKLKAIAFISSF